MRFTLRATEVVTGMHSGECELSATTHCKSTSLSLMLLRVELCLASVGMVKAEAKCLCIEAYSSLRVCVLRISECFTPCISRKDGTPKPATFESRNLLIDYRSKTAQFSSISHEEAVLASNLESFSHSHYAKSSHAFCHVTPVSMLMLHTMSIMLFLSQRYPVTARSALISQD
jgi:hypothetical protein